MQARTRTRCVLLAAAVFAVVAPAARADLPRHGLCSSRQSAHAELVCADRDIHHAETTLRWLRHHPHVGTLALRTSVRRDHVWLLRYARKKKDEATRRLNPFHVPDWFMQQALCVHDGWHHEAHPPFRRTDNVPDGMKGGTGEGSWSTVNSYGGGLQFTLGTWHRAGGVASSNADIARASPLEQIYRAFRIVVGQDHGSWSEWPTTSRACGFA